jgi:Sulfotransferase domain
MLHRYSFPLECVFILMLLVPSLAIVKGEGQGAVSEDQFSLAGVRRFLTLQDVATESDVHQNEPKKMLVIGAGNGRTGTSSLVKALARLGLKSYHMTEGVIETPGHLELWHKYYVQKTATLDQVIDRIAQDGFTATADAPLNFFYQELMQRYPDALVILTLRKDGAEGWFKSMKEAILPIQSMLDRIPLRWFHRVKMQRELLAALGQEPRIRMEALANKTMRERMIAEYDRWTTHVMTTVPEEKLLVFYAQDGWEPLCRFLSPLSTEIEGNCSNVLETGEPYPHVNDTARIFLFV